MMQAIETKYLSPTNHKGARVKATCAARSLTIGWNHALNAEQNHSIAAVLLAVDLDWPSTMVGGVLKNGNYVFVQKEKK